MIFTAIVLITSARHKFNFVAFQRCITLLEKHSINDRDVDHYINYETCLWEVNSLNYSKLKKTLESWNTDCCDIHWILKKASLYFELGENTEAYRIIHLVLAEIRNLSDNSGLLTERSLEGWALYLSLEAKDFPESDSLSKLNEMSAIRCNPFDEIENYTKILQARQVKNVERKLGSLPFDFDTERKRIITFSNAEYFLWANAMRAIRLTEIAALPHSTGDIPKVSELMGQAAENLFQYNNKLSVCLLLRSAMSDDDERIDVILSRVRIASMSGDLISELVNICLAAIEFSLTRIENCNRVNLFWSRKLGVFYEVLSRLVVRLNVDQSKSIFIKAITWYGNSAIISNQLVRNSLSHMLFRSWEALDTQAKADSVPRILKAPIQGTKNFPIVTTPNIDPGYLLLNFNDSLERYHNKTALQSSIKPLIHTLHYSGEARKRAALRLSWLCINNLISKSEKTQIAGNLWGANYRTNNDLPVGTDLDDWVFLLLPEPECGIAEERFRQKWLDVNVTPTAEGEQVYKLVYKLGSSISKLRSHDYKLRFSDVEKDFLVSLIDIWSEAPIPPWVKPPYLHRSDLIFGNQASTFYDALSELTSIVMAVEMPKTVARKLYIKFTKLNDVNVPAFRLAPGIVFSLPYRRSVIATGIKAAMVSDNLSSVSDAAVGLFSWLKFASMNRGRMSSPPIKLVEDIGIIIATRRKTALSEALEIAEWIYNYGSESQKRKITKFVNQGLKCLEIELQYNSQRDNEYKVSSLRQKCVRLALAMQNTGYGGNITISSWISSSGSDPLPEVRYVIQK